MTGPTVLGWHNVAPTWAFPVRSRIGARGLERQLRLLAATGRVVPLEPMLDDLTSGKPVRRHAVALTFDDGYRDNLDLAVPLLERFGLPATFFLVTEFLSGAATAWWERLAWALMCAARDQLRWRGAVMPLNGPDARRLAVNQLSERLKTEDSATRAATINAFVEQLRPSGRPPGPELYLDWADARELVSRGFTVGAHTLSHPILSREHVAEQRLQVTESKACLERELEVAVNVFAYPNGRAVDYTGETVAAVDAAGYRYAVTTIPGRNTLATPPRELRRFVVSASGGLREAMTIHRMLRRR